MSSFRLIHKWVGEELAELLSALLAQLWWPAMNHETNHFTPLQQEIVP